MYTFYLTTAVLALFTLGLTVSQMLRFIVSKKVSIVTSLLAIIIYVLLVVFLFVNLKKSENIILNVILGILVLINALYGLVMIIFILVKTIPQFKNNKEYKEIIEDVFLYLILIVLSLILIFDKNRFEFSNNYVVPVSLVENGSIFEYMFLVLILSLTSGVLIYAMGRITFSNFKIDKYKSITNKELTVVAIFSLLVALILITDRDLSVYTDATRERYYELVDIIKFIILGLVANVASILYKERNITSKED